MSKAIDFYKKSILVRYDKDPSIPYYDVKDFPGLIKEEHSFKNSAGEEVKYFFYYRENYKKDKVVLFCPGMGPGHTAFFREIDLLSSHGYKVLTLDYAGTGESSGEIMSSMNSPTRDVAELLKHLNLKEEIISMGHSLGGYTALNIINLFDNIKTGVIISGFLSIYLEMKGIIKLPVFARKIAKFERDNLPEYASINNEQFLFKTDKHIMMIHSKDDKLVSYKNAAKIVESYKNPHLKFVIVNGYNHNPHYSHDSVIYYNKALEGYKKLLKKYGYSDLERRKEYFSNISIEKMTNQNEEVWSQIFAHLEEENE